MLYLPAYALEPIGIASTLWSAAGFLTQNARSAPIIQRKAPTKNGVRPYTAADLFRSNINNQPPSRGPRRRPVLPADCMMPRARPCQPRSTIWEANSLKRGLAKPLPNERPAHAIRSTVRLLLAGS